MIKHLNKGFTLGELMIVIGVIGILAAALFPSLSGYLHRAKVSIVSNDLKRTGQMIATAYAIEGKSLAQITGHYCSACVCRATPNNYTGRLDTNTIGNVCYDSMTNAWTKLKNVVGSDIKVPFRDPWGGIYLLDENYLEPLPMPPCSKDRFFSAGPNSTITNSDDIDLYLDLPVPCP